MIKSWIKYNESTNIFTEEMAQEIVYTFGENSSWKEVNQSDKDLINRFNRDESIWEGIGFYETGYGEMKEFAQKMLQNANESETVKYECIEMYNLIRKINKSFPEIYKIEDIFLGMIEGYNLNFYVTVDSGVFYEIRLTSDYNSNFNLKEFNNLCDEFGHILKRLESNSYKSYINRCEYRTSHYENFDRGMITLGMSLSNQKD